MNRDNQNPWITRSCLVTFLVLLFIPSSSARPPATPVEVVRQYCNFDFKTGRISTENFAKLPPLVTWEEEPGWDTVTLVSGFRILSSKQSQDHAVVTVRWEVLGRSEGENVTSDLKSEVIEYQLRRLNGIWKIEAPVVPPHMAVPTLRAFVLSQFQDEPSRQTLWLKNLDALERKTSTKSKTLS